MTFPRGFSILSRLLDADFSSLRLWHEEKAAYMSTQRKVSIIAQEFAAAVRNRFGDRVDKIFLFGSQARGDATAESDYDFLILTQGAPRLIEDAIDDLSYEYLDRFDICITAFVEQIQNFESDLYEPLFVNIRREGIAV